jgi:hypothetical protein
MAWGLEILRDDCKVMLPKWLPYQTMLPTFAAVTAKTGIPKTAGAGSQRERLKQWFWCAVFGQAYESAPNSQSAKDVVEILRWLQGGEQPETISNLKFDPKSLRDITPRQRSIYRGVICLILDTGKGARDFHTQSVITGKLMNEEGIDDHHIFPDGYLEQAGVTSSRLRDCVLNRTLIDRTTNQMISDRAPSDYLKEIKNTPGFPFEKVLESHCLPIGDDSPLLRDDFGEFLTWRQNQLWKKIQAATGLKSATDLESDEEETV